ncbi:MAG: TonB-dependent receptor [Bacteroidota bacterium]
MKPILLFLFLCTSAGGFFAQRAVSGLVTNNGEPLIGLSVQATGTSTGTVTDIDGSYQISLPAGADSLTFSYVGFVSQTIFVGNRTTVDVFMQEATETLSQVVVVGYGVQQKDDLTGAVSVVESKDLTDIPTQNLGQALQGKVAGLQIIPASGAPGAGAIFRIRGIGTLNNADPLFVVDGMIVNDINFINPRDVESVSVLKDASATAIYGARGANGVIIITTKQGSARDGGVTISAYTGTQEVVNTIDLVNATQYATLINEADVNEGRQPRYPNPDTFGIGTDWQDEIFRTAPIANINIGFSGGSDRSTFNLTADYFRQEGIISGSEFDRFTARINTTQRVKEWFTLGGNVSLIYNNSDNINAGSVLLGAYRSDPLTPAIEEDGSFGNTAINGSTGNPVATIFFANNESQSYRAVGNVFGEIKFLKHFTIRTNFGLDFNYSRNRNFTPVFEVSAIQRNEENRLNSFNSYRRNWLWENTLAYNQTIGRHAFDGIVGVTYQDNFGEFLSGSRENLIGEDPSFFYLNAGEPLTSLASGGVSGGDWGLVSYLGRLNYTFDNRFLLTLSGRVDGSSRFGEDNRYGFFPSVGLGWNVSNEGFWNPDGMVSRFKLRGSWGQTGNDRIGDYTYTALVTSGLGAVFGPNEDLLQGSTLTGLANPGIRWEETTQVDIGVELGFFDNKLLLEADAYRRVTDGVLFAAAIPDYLGASAPTRNISEVLNEGIDLKVEWRQTSRSGFTYSIGGNASFIDNEVLKVDDLDSDLFAGGLGVGGQLGTNSRAGFPIGAFFGYELDGVFQNEEELGRFAQLGVQQPGDLRFRDQNGDGVITADGDRVVLGSAIPDLIVGINAYFAYGGFDFSFDFVGQFGNEVINAKKMARFGAYNYETDFLDRWTGEGTSNTVPRMTLAGQNFETLSSRFVEDGSYIRLRNIQLGYTLPARLTNRLRLREVRFYVSGTNL